MDVESLYILFKCGIVLIYITLGIEALKIFFEAISDRREKWNQINWKDKEQIRAERIRRICPKILTVLVIAILVTVLVGTVYSILKNNMVI